jgi:PAS domain S-box-containing protein
MISAAHKNIEEIRKREEELRKTQEYITNLVKSMPLPTSVMNSEGKRIDTNLATEKMFKRPKEEIIGLKTEELYAKEDLDKIKSVLEECKKVGSSTCQATAVREDGTTFPVVLNFSLVKDSAGNLVNILISATDITELQKREEELEKSDQFNQTLLEGMPAPFVLIDERGKWKMVNQAFEKFVGYKKEDMLGKETPKQKCTTKETIESLKKIWEKTIKKRELAEGDIPWLTGSGKVKILHSVEIPWGKSPGRFYVGVDITELKAKQKRLEQVILNLRGIGENLEAIGKNIDILVKSLEEE